MILSEVEPTAFLLSKQTNKQIKRESSLDRFSFLLSHSWKISIWELEEFYDVAAITVFILNKFEVGNEWTDWLVARENFYDEWFQ